MGRINKVNFMKVKENTAEMLLPNLSLLLWLYHRRRGIHGVDHILRVWVLTYALLRLDGENPYEKYNRELLFAATLHDVGRVNDSDNAEHGLSSAKTVSSIEPFLMGYDIPLIQELCRCHSVDDSLCSQQSDDFIKRLGILKDADALERERFNNFLVRTIRPKVLLDQKYVRNQSIVKNLLQSSRYLVKMWAKYRGVKMFSFDLHAQLLALQKILHLIQVDDDFVHLHPYVREAILILGQSFERELLTLQRIDSPDPKGFWSRILKYDELVQRHFYDKTVCRKTVPIEDDEERADFDIVVSKMEIQTFVIYSVWRRSRTLVLDRVLRFFEFPVQEYISKLVQSLATCSRKQLSSFHKKHSYLFQLSLRDKIRHTKSLISFVKLTEELVTAAYEAEINRPDVALIILDNALTVLSEIKKRSWSEILVRVIGNTLLKLFAKDFVYYEVPAFFRKYSMARALSVFDMLTDSSKYSEILDKELSVLKQLVDLGIDVDVAVQSYILPVFLSDKYHLFIDKHRMSSLIKASVLAYQVNLLVNLREKYNHFDSVLKYYQRVSSKNFFEIISRISLSNREIQLLESREQPHSDKLDWRVNIVVPGIRIFEQVIKSGRFCSVFNHRIEVSVLQNPVLKNFLKLPLVQRFLRLVPIPTLIENSSYKDITVYRDGLFRRLLIRVEDTSVKHPVHAYLAPSSTNKSQGLTIKTIINKLLFSPTKVFFRLRYGDIRLVFKPAVLDRSIFTFGDSINNFSQKYPVSLNEAKLLYFITKQHVHKFVIRRPRQALIFNYIEALILGGVTLEDIDYIITHRKVAYRIRQILEHYNVYIPVKEK